MNKENLQSIKNAYLLLDKFKEALQGRDETLDNIIYETMKGLAIIVGKEVINDIRKDKNE